MAVSTTIRTVFCIIGIAVSMYAYDVETKAEHAQETGEKYEVQLAVVKHFEP